MISHLRNFLAAAPAAAAIMAICVSSASAQNWTEYGKVGNWTINQYLQSEAAGPNQSCSAVTFADQNNGFRIERTEYGYVFGPNGLNRNEQGNNYGLDFWFDDDQSTRVGGEATFASDEAYPTDDWLSHFQSIEDPTPLAQIIASKSNITFAFPNPSGGGESVSSFSLSGSAAALKALEECFLTAGTKTAGQAAAMEQPALNGDSTCPDDGPRLPGSGVCQGQAVNYLDNISVSDEPMDGCDWVVNETPMPGGDYLFYMAARCGDRTSTLELNAGAHMATLSVAVSAVSDDGAGYADVAKVFDATDMTPEQAIMARASESITPEEKGKCIVEKVPADFGYGTDAYWVDYNVDERATLPTGEPNWVCGEMGRDDETASFWRVFGGFAWYFDMGQDGWFDFDPTSVTYLTAADLAR